MKGQEIRQGLKTAEEDVRVSPMLRARTLRAMRESGKPKTVRVKKKASFVLAAALVCVMLTAVALAAANRAGMLDFIGRYPNAELPNNAADYVHPADAAGKTAGLSAHVREEFYDGRTLRLTVDVAMENQKAILLGLDYMPTDRWQSLIHMAGDEEDETDTRSILDVYRQDGYEAMYNMSVYTKKDQGGMGVSRSGYDMVLGEDGTLTCYIEQTYDTDEPKRTVELNIRATRYREEDGAMRRESEPCAEMKLSFTVVSSAQEDASEDTWVSTEPVDYAEVGVRIDKVTMMIKPLEIYYTIDYTVTNREKFAVLDGGLDFEIIDPNSGAAEYWEQRLKDGPSGAGSSGPTDGGDWDTAVTWQQEGTLALSEWAQSYTLRAYSAWEKTRYDTHTIRMTQKN